jgi:hypothetical protein
MSAPRVWLCSIVLLFGSISSMYAQTNNSQPSSCPAFVNPGDGTGITVAQANAMNAAAAAAVSAGLKRSHSRRSGVSHPALELASVHTSTWAANR